MCCLVNVLKNIIKTYYHHRSSSYAHLKESIWIIYHDTWRRLLKNFLNIPKPLICKELLLKMLSRKLLVRSIGDCYSYILLSSVSLM